MNRIILLLSLLFIVVCPLKAGCPLCPEYIDTMSLTQANLDKIDAEIWKVYSNREFERTLPIFKGLWGRGEREYAKRQDSISFRTRSYGKSTYAQWLTLLGHYEEGLPLFQEALTETEISWLASN
jgi:hypothetical protein